MLTDRNLAVVATARLFALLAIGAPALWFRDAEVLLSLTALGLLWSYQVVTIARRDWRLTLPPIVEAVAVGVICALGMEFSRGILAALVVPPLYATAVSGVRTMVRTVAVELVAVVGFGLMWWQDITAEQGVSIFLWSMAGVGLSLVARATFAGQATADPLTSYRDAQQLLRQLLDLSGDLSSGLDVMSLGGEMLAVVGDELPSRGLVLYVPRGDTLTRVAATTELSAAEAATCEAAAVRAWARGQPTQDADAFAFGTGEHAVVSGLLGDERTQQVDFDELAAALVPSAVKLDTALLFAEFRDTATADERRRVAREMHDGVAQDLASVGYLVDAIAASPADQQQADQLAALRERVSTVIAEVRRSVMSLRTSVGENQSLGAAISAVARHQSEASGIPVRVRLDEQPARLRPEVEAELFRIAQEAINNAVRHAQAQSIEVHCQVYAPYARITVADDGVGLQAGRADSQGLEIMRERTKLIGAELEVRDRSDGGLVVSVQLHAEAEHSATPPRHEHSEER